MENVIYETITEKEYSDGIKMVKNEISEKHRQNLRKIINDHKDQIENTIANCGSFKGVIKTRSKTRKQLI